MRHVSFPDIGKGLFQTVCHRADALFCKKAVCTRKQPLRCISLINLDQYRSILPCKSNSEKPFFACHHGKAEGLFLIKRRKHFLRFRFIRHDGKVLLRGMIHRLSAKTRKQRLKLQFLAKKISILRKKLPDRRISRRKLHRRMTIDGCQALTHHGLVIIGLEILSGARRRHFIHMCICIFDAVEFHDDAGRGLFSDSSDTGDIVTRIAHQRLQINEFRRCNLIGLLHILRIIVFDLRSGSLRLRDPDPGMVGSEL